MKWQIIDKAKDYKIIVRKNEEIGIMLWLNQPGDYQVEVDLEANGARAIILGAISGEKKNEIRLTTRMVHEAGNTHAETIIYGINRDESETILKGMIRIEKKAGQVTDFLTEKIILLSEKAKALVEPSLEIKANEVRASHAATVARIDEKQIYYLMSRGVSRQEAEQLIVDGFFQVIINKIDDDKIRNKVCLMLKQ